MTPKHGNSRSLIFGLLLLIVLAIRAPAVEPFKTGSDERGQSVCPPPVLDVIVGGSETKLPARKAPQSAMPLVLCPDGGWLVIGLERDPSWTFPGTEPGRGFGDRAVFSARAPPSS